MWAYLGHDWLTMSMQGRWKKKDQSESNHLTLLKERRTLNVIKATKKVTIMFCGMALCRGRGTCKKGSTCSQGDYLQATCYFCFLQLGNCMGLVCLLFLMLLLLPLLLLQLLLTLNSLPLLCPHGLSMPAIRGQSESSSKWG